MGWRGHPRRKPALAEVAPCAAPAPAWNRDGGTPFESRAAPARGKTRPAPEGAATRCTRAARSFLTYSSQKQTIRAQSAQQALVIIQAAHLGNVQVETHRPEGRAAACSACSPGQLGYWTCQDAAVSEPGAGFC